MFRRPEVSRSTVSYVLVLLLLFTFKYIVLMRGSAIYGRLAMPPLYDDVTYFADAMQRLRVFFDQGLYAYISGIVTHPPHAHYPTIAASLAFLIAGPHIAGPYFVNALTLAVLAAALATFFRFGLLTTVCLGVVLISTLWFDYAVTTFHPDLVAGFATSVMSAVLIWQSEIIRTRSAAVLTGVAATLILFIKPVAFAMVLGTWGVAMLAGIIAAWQQGESTRDIATRVLYGALPLLIIAGPYFAREAVAIFDYFYLGFVREREAWAARLDPSEHALYYINEAMHVFGNWVWVAIVGTFGVMAVGAYGRDRTTLIRFGGLIAVAFAGYIVPQSLEVKHIYYGSVFYGGLAVCLMLSVHFLADRLHLASFRDLRLGTLVVDQRRVRTAGLLAIGLVALTGLSDKQMRFPADMRVYANQEYDGVYGILKRVIKAKEHRGDKSSSLPVLFLYPTPVAPHAYVFRGLMEDLNITPDLAPHSTDIKQLIDKAGRASVVVIPDDQTAGVGYPFLVRKLLPAFRDWIAHDGRLRLVETVHTDIGSVDVYSDVPLGPDAASPSTQN